MSKCFNFKHCSVVPQTERLPDMHAFITHSDILNILHAYILTDLLTYLLTHSMEQSPS